MTKNWTNIHHEFTDQLAKEWANNGFTYETTQDWINIGLKPTDANFCYWLEQEGYTALAVLNYADSEELRQEYHHHLTNPKPTANFPSKPNWKFIISLLALILIMLLITN